MTALAWSIGIFKRPMPSLPRLKAIEQILDRSPVAVEPSGALSELWARVVFSLDKMKSALPKVVF